MSNLVRVRLVLTEKDLQGNIGNISDCPMYRSLKRRLKKDVEFWMGVGHLSVVEDEEKWKIKYYPVAYYNKVANAQYDNKFPIHIYMDLPQELLK